MFNNSDIEINNDKINNDENIDNLYRDNTKMLEIKKSKPEVDLKNEYNNKHINDNKNNINSNKALNNIYTSSQGYFSFKIKKNNIKEKEKEKEKGKEKEIKIDEKDKKNNFIKDNESIGESISSSKFNFKINDDIHESEFNDVEFLD